MRWSGFLLLCALAACGPDSALSVPLASLNPMNMFAASAGALADDVEEPDGPYLRLAQGRRASDARLISQQGERRMWRTRGGVVVATDGVRVVATAGLPTMVAATRFDGPDPVAEPQSLVARSADARRVIDVMTASRDPSEMRFGIALNCRLSSAPSAEADTVIITETCRGEGLGVIRNRFWMDRDTSSIHTSEQWIGPRTAPLRISHNLEAAEAAPAAAPAAVPPAAPVAAPSAGPALTPVATPKATPLLPPRSPLGGSDAPARPQ
ncbi:MAG: YjbF family lipoprotein [Rubritepida sp.]|nr:YjbF family lipoprotein [Rubritepida sp.]